jgi:hypothetical protein
MGAETQVCNDQTDNQHGEEFQSGLFTVTTPHHNKDVAEKS